MSSQIVVPAAARSVISATPKTTFKVGSYSALSDTFTSVLDLNDHVNYWLVSADLAQPKKVYSRSTTIRAAGERIANWNYQNRHITLTIQLLYEAGTSALLGAVRGLLAAIENPPYRLAFAAPNSTVLTYADVVAVTHTIPYDGKQILARTLTKISIDFECAPGFAGDLITLSNLVVNPGFEAPSGPGVQVFSDTFANANAYAVQAGGAPTISANVMTIPTGGRVAFGSPDWGAINQWAVRWQATSGTQAAFYLHYTDGSNSLFWQCFYGGLGLSSALVQLVGGTAHVLSSSSPSFTAGNWYWLVATQFPAAPGTPPEVLVTIYNDSAGAIGTVLGTFGPVATFDSVTALSGRPQMVAIGGALPVGGAFSSVHTVNLFGPGAHLFVGSGGTGRASGAWEQNTANTYTGGAVTSYGAARIDCAPAGTTQALWQFYQGGAPAGSNAIPASTGQTLGLSAEAKSTGLGSSATIALFVEEYDASGAMLRGTTLQTLTGNQASWTQLSGTLTLGASTAYVDIQLVVTDSTSASANATIWFDNMQCWNQTATGQTVMPYCEMRFPQSPAQLLLTGLQGDMVAPAQVSMGTYLATWNVATNLRMLCGRRATPSTTHQMVTQIPSQIGTTPALDSASYGGYYVSNAGPTFQPFPPVTKNLDAAGLFHLYSRYKTTQSAGNLGNITQQAVALQYLNYPAQSVLDTAFPQYLGAQQPASLTSNAWSYNDAGYLSLPPFPQGTMMNSQSIIFLPYVSWNDATGGSPTQYLNWELLMPVDGSVLIETLANPNSGSTYSGVYVWLYVDGLIRPQPDTAATQSYTISSAPTPSESTSASGGTGSGSAVTKPTIVSLADSLLQLDPQPTLNGVSGVNQLAALITDDNGTVYNQLTEIAYTPLYLYPRQQ